MLGNLRRLVSEKAAARGIEPEVFAALIYQESKGKVGAYRFEPAFYERYIFKQWKDGFLGYIPKNIPLYEEAFRRSASYGLCQVMGQTCREMGFDKEDLRLLFDPEVNLEWGAKLFAYYFEKVGNLHGALLRYNGGGDPDYPNKVQRWIGSSETRFLLTDG